MPKSLPFKAIEGEEVGHLVSSAFMAWMLSASDRTLRDWAQYRGCPRYAPGWWNPQAVLAWRLNTGKPDSSDDEVALETRKLLADTDYREVRAERERLLKEILEGKYLRAEEVEEEWARRVSEVRTSLTSMARQIAAGFSDPEVRRSVERAAAREVKDMCDQYSRTGRYTPKKTKT